VSNDAATEDAEEFGYWTGYAPGKDNPGGRQEAEAPMIPLSADELHAEAMRFRRGADRALELGDAAMAERLRRAADDFQQRADVLS
jgi:hypothetical protein